MLSNTKLIKSLPIPLVLALSSLANAKNPSVAAGELADYSRRADRFEQLSNSADAERRAAVELARKLRLPVDGKSRDGGGYILRRLGLDGMPVYSTTLSTDAANSTNASTVQRAPYGYQGEGLIVGVWDAGSAHATHQEFNNTGVSRVIVGDGTQSSQHGTIVTGLLISGGVDANSLGMAPRAMAECYDMYNDYAEVVARAAASPDDIDNLTISNHSYGDLHGWQGMTWYGPYWSADGSGPREDVRFGRYGEEAAQLDSVLYGAPYYNYFKAAGNDRNQKYTGPRDGTGSFYHWNGSMWVTAKYDAATAPFDDNYDNGGYDTIIDNANAKNVITVGAIHTAMFGGVRDSSRAAVAAFSNWGPTDDGRIKPDLVGRGAGIYAPTKTSNTSYSNPVHGTSFASPNVAGTALLVVDMIKRELGTLLRASTVKGILIHTATEAGNPGPDYIYGWGVPDAKAAADLVLAQKNSPDSNHITEGLLSGANPSDSYSFYWDGSNEFRATLTWTDPPAAPLPAILDSRTPALVNDLDIRLLGPDGTIYRPWVLNPAVPSAPATTGDNVVDNVEQIRLTGGKEQGMYQLSVTHKGSLVNGHQWYSLTVSGQRAATPRQVVVSQIIPNQLFGNSGTVSVEIRGENITPGTQAILRRAGHADIHGANEYSSGDKLFASFDTNGGSIGDYNVVLVRPDGSEGALASGLTFESTLPEIDGPTSMMIREGEGLSFSLSASSPVAGQSVNLALENSPSCVTLGSLVVGNPTTAALNVQPTYNCGGTTYNVTIKAVDSTGAGQATHTFALEILNTPTLKGAVSETETAIVVEFDSAMAESGAGSVLNAGAYRFSDSRYSVSSVQKVSANKYRLNVAIAPSTTKNTSRAKGGSGATTTSPLFVIVSNVTDTQGNSIATDERFCSATVTASTTSGGGAPTKGGKR